MLADDLGFDKQFAECRVCRIGGRRCEHDFRVARDVEHPASGTTVGDADPAQLDVVFRRNGDHGMRLDTVVDAMKGREPDCERCLVGVGSPQCRLMRGRPDDPVGHIADITEGAPVVAGGVFSPTRDREVVPAAVAAAGAREHDVVPAVRQQLHLRYRRVRAA